MTCNQVIVLMDCRRGFDASRHSGTLNSDLRRLQSMGLVESGRRSDWSRSDSFEWELTSKGDKVVKGMLAVGEVTA